MALQTAAIKNAMCAAYVTACAYVALATTTPGGSAGTEVSGGSPAYARVVTNWGSPSGGVVVGAPAAQNVPSGTTVVGVNMMSALTAGTYYDGALVTSQAFASQGTYTVVPTFTAS